MWEIVIDEAMLALQILFVGAFIVQIFFWWLVFPRLHRLSGASPPLTDAPPVSVVVCAYNAAADLRRFLPSVLEQNYPVFEVWVVNDASTDNTAAVLADFQAQYAHLRVLNRPNKPQKGKKQALSAGIRAAQYEWLLLTDADCYPLSRDWISTMVAARQPQTEVVLAYAPYDKHPSFLNQFIRFETVWTALQYMGLALAGRPYMGVGRNLMYKKSLFLAANGFEKHAHILSGDDDLFVNQVIRPDNFALTLAPASFVTSPPKMSWKAYFQQKKRHISVGVYYDWPTKCLLAALAVSHFGIYLGSIGLLFLGKIGLLPLFLVRCGLVAYHYRRLTKKMGEQDLWPYFPILESVLVAYYAIFAFSLFKPNQKW